MFGDSNGVIGAEASRALLDALEVSVSAGDLEAWAQATLNVPGGDVFSALLAPALRHDLFEAFNGSLNQWLLNIEPWQHQIQDPRHSQSLRDAILYRAWDVFHRSVSDQLRTSKALTGLPEAGHLLAFVGGLARCIVLSYVFAGPVPYVRPAAVIDSPRSAFDVWTAIDQAAASATARNVLKNTLASGHKIISHLGVLIHVDRRREPEVFGPSIDTLVLGELLASSLPNWPTRPYTLLEVGCGSGFLTAMMARCVRYPAEVVAVDSEPSAILCTARALRSAQLPAGPKVHLINGKFTHDFVNRRFDLIECNPPYVPTIDQLHVSGLNVMEHVGAVAGVELGIEVVDALPELLAEGGQALVMCSSVSKELMMSAVPAQYGAFEAIAGGWEVLFDVEAVLNRPSWLAELRDRGGLSERDGVLYHTLHPVWVREA